MPAPDASFGRFNDSDVVDDTEAAALLKVSVHTMRSWRCRPEPRGPRFIKAQGLIRYQVGALKDFLSRNTTHTIDDPAPALRRVG